MLVRNTVSDRAQGAVGFETEEAVVQELLGSVCTPCCKCQGPQTGISFFTGLFLCTFPEQSGEGVGVYNWNHYVHLSVS